MIEVQNLSKVYPFYGSVLRGISFTVPDGQIVGVLGKNGVGKTTLLRMLAGVLKGEGTVRFDGKARNSAVGNWLISPNGAAFSPR